MSLSTYSSTPCGLLEMGPSMMPVMMRASPEFGSSVPIGMPILVLATP